MEGFNFAIWEHKTGIMMISIDSLIGFLRSDHVESQHTFEDLAKMLERMVDGK